MRKASAVRPSRSWHDASIAKLSLNFVVKVDNKEKAREYQRLYHLRTWDKRKERHKILRNKRKRELENWLKEYKRDIICQGCGENHPGCLDFHHKNPKDKIDTISDLVIRGYARETILREIKKCAVLCKNCRAKLHYKELTSGIS